ncbi:MAG: putative metallo-hydrolase [Firmicutes bacterium ADurb.Bin080]|jgi:hydroxyacylglutathione hydrolase|nr:MBL fold metallo-hydrolase [Clostridiales bacterium]OQC14597.1 MAG: putative metallo-hydrolase [Firmicutes bacterium ADurb.Bin080]
MIEVKTFVSGYLKNNSYLIYDPRFPEKSVLIDPSESFSQVKEYLNNNQLFISDIFLTHGHFDHVIDVPRWKIYDVCVHIHKNEIPNITGYMTKNMLKNKKLSDIIVDDYFVDGRSYKICESITLNVLFTPGHTAGSCSFVIDNMIFSGDTLFKESYGRTDFSDGNFSEIKNSIVKLFLLPEDFIIYPGHYEKTLLSYEKKYNPIRYDL